VCGATNGSEQEVTLGHRQGFRWLTPQQHAIGLELTGLWIDVDVRQVVVVDQVGFLHVAAAFDHGDFLFQTQGFGQAGILRHLADENQAGGVQRPAEAGEPCASCKYLCPGLSHSLVGVIF